MPFFPFLIVILLELKGTFERNENLTTTIAIIKYMTNKNKK